MQADHQNEWKPMNIGFVGTGAITAAMVEGLLRRRELVSEISVSPRNADIAARIACMDACVMIADDNQHVLDRADIVVLAVRPQIAAEVVQALRFRPEHHVISVMATIDLATLRSWIAPASQIVRAIPLPFVAENAGTTPLFPPDPIAFGVFSALGTAIETRSEAELDLFLVASGLMGTYFQLMQDCSDWLVEHGLEKGEARTYLRSLFAGLSDAPKKHPDTDYAALRDEFSTAGGINEQGFKIFRSQGGSEAVRSALSAIHARVTGTSSPK